MSDSNNVKAGITSIRTAISSAITSASEDECDTDPCFLHIHITTEGIVAFHKGRVGPFGLASRHPTNDEDHQ